MNAIGIMPLPPYIKRNADTVGIDTDDKARYQTVYADKLGAVAAPTAGLHFTPELLDKLRERGVKVCFITLHVGEGTFRPIRAEKIVDHHMHEEWYEIGNDTMEIIERAKEAGQRVFGVGTSVTRVMETIARYPNGKIPASLDCNTQKGSGWTSLFIYPPQKITSIDGLLTNFHLPGSTPLLLASAFAGREHVLNAYEEAKAERYRFYSYGDAMLIL